MELTLEAAGPERRETLAALLQLYLYDFSEFDLGGADVDEAGRFVPYTWLDSYVDEPDHSAYLVRADGRIAGFALVRRLDRPGGEPTWGLAEFFILRRYRRRGLGRRAAVALFERLPGRWEVGQIHANAAAIAFWRRVIGDYTGGRYSEIGLAEADSPGPLQIFRSPPPPGEATDLTP